MNENHSEVLTEEQGRLLLQLARLTILCRFKPAQSKAELAALEPALKDPVFREKRGTFVTLHIDGQLRGCIGNLIAYTSLREGVEENALNAAFRDFRFNELSQDEYRKIKIEISVLTEPHPLNYVAGSELPGLLRKGIDGVIIKKGGNSATFLPQVWKQLPDPEHFLNHLCRKACLPEDTWRNDKLEVMTYQVQSFEED